MNQIIGGGCIGALLLIFCICIFNVGVAVGLSRTTSNCDDFGKFKHSDVYYECKRLGVTK